MTKTADTTLISLTLNMAHLIVGLASLILAIRTSIRNRWSPVGIDLLGVFAARRRVASQEDLDAVHAILHSTDPGLHAVDPSLHAVDPGGQVFFHSVDPGLHAVDLGTQARLDATDLPR